MCKQCILDSSLPNVTITDGLCSVCDRYNKSRAFGIDMNDSGKIVLDNLDILFKTIKNRNQLYDVVVGFSGGKDSSYLLHILKNVYKLKVLAVSVIHPLHDDCVSKSNIRKVAKKIDVDVLKVNVPEEPFMKFMQLGLSDRYRHYFGINPGCALCAHIRNAVISNTAIKAQDGKIPLVAIGTDLYQHDPFVGPGDEYYKIVDEIFSKTFGSKYEGGVYSFKPDALLSIPNLFHPYSKKDIENVGQNNSTFFISPLKIGVIKYKYKDAFKLMNDCGVSLKKSHFLITNCTARILFDYISFKRFNYFRLTTAVAKMVRTGKKERAIAIEYFKEYARVLDFIAKDKNNVEIDNKYFRKKFPDFHKVFFQFFTFQKFLNKEEKRDDYYFNQNLDKMKKLHYNAERFGIDLKKIISK